MIDPIIQMSLAMSLQLTATNCSWVGNVWTCSNSDTSVPVPVDQGSILRSGMGAVPNYENRKSAPEQVRTVDPEKASFDFELALKNCEIDRQAFLSDDRKRFGSPDFMGGYLSEDQRQSYNLACKAYLRGRLAGTEK